MAHPRMANQAASTCRGLQIQPGITSLCKSTNDKRDFAPIQGAISFSVLYWSQIHIKHQHLLDIHIIQQQVKLCDLTHSHILSNQLINFIFITFFPVLMLQNKQTEVLLLTKKQQHQLLPTINKSLLHVLCCFIPIESCIDFSRDSFNLPEYVPMLQHPQCL